VFVDADLRDLERAWKESGSDEDCEAFLVAKVRSEGWPIRRVLELAMASLIDRKPTPAEVVLWIETDCLPCSRAGCPRAATPELTYQATSHRLCGECFAGGSGGFAGGSGGSVRIIGGENPFGRRCLRRGCGMVVHALRESLFCSDRCESLAELPRPTAPPGTYGPGDYGPDSFGGSDY
jgi:hypothetical protein